ncbi:MFS transporter [Williamsia deligens]|nr:putative arabinose efflux permease, MFS family [Williamsia deligens]
MGFVVGFGVVSMLTDMVYEGARSITGPYLAALGASAAVVGLITGVGEAVALILRMVTGPISDRVGRQWDQSMLGYAMTAIAAPLIALTGALWSASALVIVERFGKAVRTPARDTMLAQASAGRRRGRVFAVHEALDQSGALIGPLLVAGAVAWIGYRAGFGVLAIPGALALVALLWLRRAVPAPASYEESVQRPSTGVSPTRLPAEFWRYAVFTAVAMAGSSTFAVLAFHMHARHVIPDALIPVVYAGAMAAAAAAAIVSGRLYDAVGMRALMIALPLAAAVPVLVFTTSAALVVIGAVVWGASMGVHESTFRAAVADLVPATRRGTGFGVFAAVYGVAWLGGSVLIGALYERSVPTVIGYTAATQIAAAGLLLAITRGPRSGSTLTA